MSTSTYGDSSDENPLYTANVIANTRSRIGRRGRRDDDHKELFAASSTRRGDVEANVATGYHAIEFLLWGQDLNGTGPAPATGPASD